MVGSLLIRQDVAESIDNVEKRIIFIKNEM